MSGQSTAPGATAMAASNWSTSHPQYTQLLPLFFLFVFLSLNSDCRSRPAPVAKMAAQAVALTP